MGKRVKKALYSQGGSVKPAPKSEKLVGEFRLPLAPGDRHLLPYGMRAPNAERIFNKRRYRDPNEDYPERGRATAGMADGGGVIDDLRESLEMRAAAQPDQDERAENLGQNAYDLASSLPVTGNVISAKEGIESGGRAYEAARSGKLKRALAEAGLTGLNALGAVTGLPWGKLAGKVAREAPNRLNTFVTAEPGAKSDLARRMREDGISSPNIMRNTDRFYAPDGSLRQEVSDRGATVKRIFQPGDTATMGDVLAHEKLYRRFPHLRETPVRFVDEKFEQANAPGKVLGSAFMDKDGSGYGMTGGMPEEFYKDQGTKLLNYRVSEEAGFAPALRHKATLNLADYDHAIAMAQEIAKNPRPGEDVAQAMAFLERLQPQRDKLHAAMQTATDDRANRLVARVTNRQNDVALGNIDARIARKRATIGDADRQAWGDYPYEKGTAGVGPGWRNSVILPPRGADREGTAKFIDQFTRLGAGRPGIGFANGGRTKKTRRTLAKLTVGAVRGVTEGRSDELPVSVPAGSYVIPADVVAALGDGNSEAGMHKLESTLGRPRRAAGGSVPIQISHGEFVVTPDQVEALGGHDALDQLVLRTRAAYTKHLQNLPGPNQ